jgi:hypothetical protein
MFEFVFLLHDLIDVILAVEVPPQFGNFSLVLLNAYFLVFEFLLELDHSFIFFDLVSDLFLLLAFSFLLGNLVHFGC